MRFRRGILLALVVTLALNPGPAAAQSAEGDDDPTRWRRWAGAVAGALILGGVATYTDQAGEEARTGVCDTTTCVVAIGGLIGAGLGFLLGSEMDRKAVRRAREGPTVEVPLQSVELAESPTGLMEGDLGVFAFTRDQVFVVDDSMRAQPILSGFGARASAVGLDGDLLVLASSSQIVGVPLPGSADEPLPIADWGAAAMTALGDGALAVSDPGRIRRLGLSGSRLAPNLLEEGTVATSGLTSAMDLGMGGTVLWTVEDSTLVARNPTSLAETTRLRLPGRISALNLAGPTAMVALGDGGAVSVDVSDPRDPQVGFRLTGMDFAYDAAVLDGRAYVAAGAQGVFVYDLDASGEPVKLGVIREPDFAGDLLIHRGHLYILDRSGDNLYRM